MIIVPPGVADGPDPTPHGTLILTDRLGVAMARGYEVVAEAMLAERVEVLFGLLGNTNLALAGVLAGRGLRFVSGRHETGAVSIAAGYAWASGRPAACTVTHGPGLSNALTGLTSAARDRIPLVLLIGDIRHGPEWMAQRADHRAMLAWTGAEVVDCERSEALVSSVRYAFQRAASARKPVVVNIPAELLESEALPQHAFEPDVAESRSDTPDLSKTLAALNAAKRPLILAGRGALWAGAGAALRALGEATGAMLATTLPAKGLFAGDPYDLGVCGGYSTPETRRLIADSDYIFAFGAGLNGYTREAITEATIVHCDLSPHPDAHVQVRGDALSIADGLFAAWGDKRQRPQSLTEPTFVDGSDRGGLDPRAVLRAINSALPADRQVVIDLGHFSSFPTQLLSVPEGGRFLPALGFGSVGLSIATGIGAALGRAVRTVVVVGDGGALMSLGELETLRRLDLPVTVVVLNDRAYGAEIHHLRRHRLPEALALFPRADLAGVARALGVAAVSVSRPADLHRLGEWLVPDRPILVDAQVTRSVVAAKFVSS